MPRDLRLAELESRDEIANRPLATAKHVENLPSAATVHSLNAETPYGVGIPPLALYGNV